MLNFPDNYRELDEPDECPNCGEYLTENNEGVFCVCGWSHLDEEDFHNWQEKVDGLFSTPEG